MPDPERRPDERPISGMQSFIKMDGAHIEEANISGNEVINVPNFASMRDTRFGKLDMNNNIHRYHVEDEEGGTKDEADKD